jgi:phosphate transport system permease protein
MNGTAVLQKGEALRLSSRFFIRGKEKIIEALLLVSALASIAITLGIVGILVYESTGFFQQVSVLEFLTDTQWTPLFSEPHFGIMALVSGTVVTTVVALAVAVPMGSLIAIYLSEYASPAFREVVKPALELLSAVPTVVYGYFALLFVTPALQKVWAELPGFNMLSAGLVIGLMIVPYVSSVSEDAMRAVPLHLREGAFALGATRMQSALRVVFPSALSGITAAYVLGISRAIGETMVVAIAAGMQPTFTWNPLEPAATMTAYIVQVSLGDLPHGSIGYQTIFVTGLTLLVMTLLFNVAGHVLKKRYRQVY